MGVPLPRKKPPTAPEHLVHMSQCIPIPNTLHPSHLLAVMCGWRVDELDDSSGYLVYCIYDLATGHHMRTDDKYEYAIFHWTNGVWDDSSEELTRCQWAVAFHPGQYPEGDEPMPWPMSDEIRMVTAGVDDMSREILVCARLFYGQTFSRESILPLRELPQMHFILVDSIDVQVDIMVLSTGEKLMHKPGQVNEFDGIVL